MFQNIVNATEPMAEEKDAIAYISNNPIRKEIVMYVTDFKQKIIQLLRKLCPVCFEMLYL